MTTLKASLLQIAPYHGGSLDAYLTDLLAQMRSAGQAADLIVLPELWHVGYFDFDHYASAATPIDGAFTRQFAELARELRIVLHIGSIVEAGPPMTNTSLVFGPDGTRLASYRKIHLFGYGSREPELLGAGGGAETFPIADAHAGLATCYDLRFPELFRSLADRVSLYTVPATWPASRVSNWSVLLQARAIENQAFVLGCNAAGSNCGVELGGHSAVVDPVGKVIAEAGAGPERLDAVIDLALVAHTRRQFPALADRVWPVPAEWPDGAPASVGQ